MDEIRRIIQDYKEELEAAGSEYRRRCLKEDAFDAILKVIEAIDKDERPKSSLERPLYKGVLFVDDYGINKVIEVDDNGTVMAERIISRDTFIEAYNKFIKGEEQKDGAV